MIQDAKGVIVIRGECANLYQAIWEMVDIARGYGQAVDVIIENGEDLDDSEWLDDEEE
jgi:hypothetical protein